MSVWTKIIGTIQTAWQVGLGGPQVKNNAGNIDARNAADSAYVNVRVATAVGANDAVPFAQLPASSPTSRAYYGDGSDGAATFDGSSTPTGSVKDSATAYHLTRDVYYTSIAVSTGVTVSTHGERVFCTGTTTLTGAGSIANNGAAGTTTQTAGLGGSLGSIGGSAPNPGGAGGATLSAGSNAVSLSTNAFGGAGGAGGTGQGGGSAGGTGGTTTPQVGAQLPHAGPDVFVAASVATGATVAWTHVQGGGGGGGGGGGSTGVGAGGGGGGGVVMVATQTLTGSGNITANGGPGNNGAANNGGGGGGGGGGVVFLIASVTSGWTGALQANGGALGNGNGSGANGVAGSAGVTVQVAG